MKSQYIFGAQLTLVLSPFSNRIHRCDFSPRGSPDCSINETIGLPWFFAAALPASGFRRFVISRRYKTSAHLRFPTCTEGWQFFSCWQLWNELVGLRMILRGKLATISVRFSGIYCVKAKVEWSAGIKELAWPQRGSVRSVNHWNDIMTIIGWEGSEGTLEWV